MEMSLSPVNNRSEHMYVYEEDSYLKCPPNIRVVLFRPAEDYLCIFPSISVCEISSRFSGKTPTDNQGQNGGEPWVS